MQGSSVELSTETVLRPKVLTTSNHVACYLWNQPGSRGSRSSVI